MKDLLKLTEYLKIYKENQGKEHGFEKNIKVALLSSFTIKGLKEVLAVQCSQEEINCHVYEAPYGQYFQQLLEEKSDLKGFCADVAIFLIDIRDILGDFYFNPYAYSLEERRALAEEKKENIFAVIEAAKKNLSGKIIFNNFQLPTYSPLGILENKQEFGFFHFINYLNDALEEAYRKDDRVFIFDFEGFSSKLGKESLMDNKMYYMGDIKISLGLIPALAWEYLRYFRPMLFLTKKCLVVDLDGTLWGGVLGEEGVSGISLGTDPVGKVYYEFQKNILALYERGVILAINSKNNIEDVEEILDKHPFMLLKKNHFAVIKANWGLKSDNMLDIAKELNIGLDSMVFLDDDSFQCQLMKNTLPQVLTLQMPRDTTAYSSFLKETAVYFNLLSFTQEDSQKNKMYAETAARNRLKESVSMEEFLESLNIFLSFEKMNENNTKRIAQLTQKTNQFNLSGRRYFAEELPQMCQDGYEAYCVGVKDSFGDNGICGAIILKISQGVVEIDNLLLSCRVLGRGIENSMLSFILGLAKQKGAAKVVAQVNVTEKNKPFSAFYKEHGFEESGGFFTLALDLEKDVNISPEYIRWEYNE